MAGPIVYIVLALKVLPFMPQKDSRAFIVGAVFRNIQHLDVSIGALKNLKNITWHDIVAEPDSFIAGAKFQVFVDEQREKYIKEHKLYGLLPSSMFVPYALKFNDDLLLYDMLKEKQCYIDYLNDILEQQKKYKIKEHYIKAWHKALQRYIEDPRGRDQRFKFMKRCAKKRFRLSKDGYFYDTKKAVLLKVNGALFDNLEKVLEQARQHDKIKQRMLSFYETFLELAQIGELVVGDSAKKGSQ